MYKVLLPIEKLVFLSFWQDAAVHDAAERCGIRPDEAAGIAEKLAGMGLAAKTRKGYKADLSYLVEMIERDNHFYPHMRLGPVSAAAFAAWLGSDAASKLAMERFGSARTLAAEGKEVLSGFFSEAFMDLFIIAGAYAEVFGADDSPGNRAKCADALLSGQGKGIFPQGTPEMAFRDDLVFSIPKDSAACMKWSVNQSPRRFRLIGLFRSIRDRGK